MKRILIINTVGFRYEGISMVITNYLSHMDKQGFEFDFLCFPETEFGIKKYLRGLGNVITISNRKENTFKYCKEVHNILKKKYEVIHIHGNSGTMVIEVILAKVHRVKNIIVHCHNTTCNHPVLNVLLKRPMINMSTHLLACSDASGKWLYDNNKFVVLNNAIDTNRFHFNNEVREECRSELGLKNEYVIGHIGRFDIQKNHDFMIEVFAKFHKKMPCSKLLLVSDGPKREEIQKKVFSKGLENVVIFAGCRSDTEKLYCAMDVFMLPSLWEGLPLVMIEAQVSGLPVLASDVITKEAECTNRVWYKSLDDGIDHWADCLSKISMQKYDRTESVENGIRKHGFDIALEAEKLREVYLS